MKEPKSGRREEKEGGQVLNELFDQIHIKGEAAMKQLRPPQTQCFDFSSPSQLLSLLGTISSMYRFTYPTSP